MSVRTIRLIGTILLALAIMALLGLILYRIPSIGDRVDWQIASLRADIKYALSPPDQAVFKPDPTLSSSVAATLSALTPSPSPSPTAGPTVVSSPTVEPTATPNPIPASTTLEGVIYVDQHNRWNYCGPANPRISVPSSG